MIGSAQEIAGLRVLIVDDESANLRLLERILYRAGFSDVRSTTSGRTALAMAAAEVPDIVLLDLHLPELGGVEILRALNGHGTDFAPLVLVLTGDDSPGIRSEVLAAGARDFITKPFDTTEVTLRIKNFAELRLLHKQLRLTNTNLEDKVRDRTAELDEARLDILDRLAKAAEFRDDATGQHTRRVGIMARHLASALSLTSLDIDLIARAAPLHDVGKIAIPDRILLKPGPLTEDEMTVMRTHTTTGAQLLSGSRSPLLEKARIVAHSHHERWDGQGYPDGLAGGDIPLAGRIVAVADFFDALSHDRPYRPGYSTAEVVALIVAERGRHFDPAVVDAFLEIMP